MKAIWNGKIIAESNEIKVAGLYVLKKMEMSVL